MWVTGDKWGPYSGYADASVVRHQLSAVPASCRRKRNGQMQGAAVKIPVSFTSSALRARCVNPKDGSTLVGLKGWQTNAAERRRFLDRACAACGRTPHYAGRHSKPRASGVYLTYATGLDPAYANDASNWVKHHRGVELRRMDQHLRLEGIQTRRSKQGRDALTVSIGDAAAGRQDSLPRNARTIKAADAGADQGESSRPRTART